MSKTLEDTDVSLSSDCLHNRDDKTILIFFPWNVYPPNVGSRQRFLEILAGLKENGLNVILVSSNLDRKWDTSSIRFVKKKGVSNIYVFTPTIFDQGLRKIPYVRPFSYFYQKSRLVSYNILPLMRHWFSEVLKEVAPSIILMNYPDWNWILDHQKFKNIHKIIDSHDLFTTHMQMRFYLKEYFRSSPPFSIDNIRDEVLREDFFEKLDLTVNLREFEIYDRYNYTMSISPTEAEIIRKNTRHTKVLFVPMTRRPRYIKNNYVGPALFSAGPHPFNIQGYLCFIKRVLPLIKDKVPSFKLFVTGGICNYVSPVKGISFFEHLPDLETIYESTRFFVSPVFGGTGQQVKIIEAMANGLPVVAFRGAPGTFPIENGINGLVAGNAEEFADKVIQLWNDRQLCQRLGAAARNTVAANFSRTRLVEALSLALQ